MDELVRFAERCNSCLGEDGHVKENIESINEIATACHYALLALEKATLDRKDIDQLIQFFIRQLRPGINGEFEHGYVLLKLGMSKTDKDLRTLYRRIQGFLDLDDPVDIPEPSNI